MNQKNIYINQTLVSLSKGGPKLGSYGQSKQKNTHL